MAKKKTHYKRHHFSQEHLGTVVAPKNLSKPDASPTNDVENTTVNQYAYVTKDLLRVLWLGGGSVAILVILWVLFTQTGLGSTVYGWVTF